MTPASATGAARDDGPAFTVGLPPGHGKRHAISAGEMDTPRPGYTRRSLCGRLVMPQYTDNPLEPLAWPTNQRDYGCATCRARVDKARQSARLELMVTMRMTEQDAAALADAGVTDNVMELLWLRAVLVEQRRRTPISERDEFDDRADRILRRLALAPGPSGPGIGAAGRPATGATSERAGG